MKVFASMALAITVCFSSGCAAVAVHEARVCQAVQQMMLADQEQKKLLPTPHSYPAPIRVVLKND